MNLFPLHSISTCSSDIHIHLDTLGLYFFVFVIPLDAEFNFYIKSNLYKGWIILGETIVC